MKYPKINMQPTRTVNIPSLAGGMNLRDSLNLCNDNQLTDSLNMWFRDGVLKTRAGKRILKERIFAVGAGSNDRIEWDKLDCKEQCHSNITKTVEGKTYVLVSYLYVYEGYRVYSSDENNQETVTFYNDYSTLRFFWVGDGGVLNQYPISVNGEYKILNYFPVVSSKDMYLFLNTSNAKTVYRYDNSTELWCEVPDDGSEDGIYAPVVYAHCKTTGTLMLDDKSNVTYSKIDFKGTQFEGYSSISQYYRMIYSTVNKELLTDKISKLPMKYNLSTELLSKFEGKKIKAKITHSDGTVAEHEAEIMSNGQAYEATPNKNDNLIMCVKGVGIWFEYLYNQGTDNEYTEIAYLTADDFLEDNLELILPCECNAENLDKIFNMTRAEWFGGASEGINGGTRLFLGGNTKESEQSLMVWSELNNPLYFSENSYSYVGNSMSAVTAFGKQSDMLVIFKENELYYTQYTQNTNITAEDLINQSVIDYSASRVYFPLTQIHSGIGCDCPDTIQLCRNRLVWADSSGLVYTLTNNNQFSERNIFCVSEMIYPRLKGESKLSTACSVDWNGYYMLLCDNRVYLMDYNSYGYQYIASHSKTEDANIRIPWYYWELPDDNGGSVYYTVNNKLYCFSYGLGFAHGEMYLYIFEGDTDNGQPIMSMAQTKIFDFGQTNIRKNIEGLDVSFGNNGGEAITVNYITDSGTDFETVTLTDNETDIRNAGYISSVALRPCIRAVKRFGVKFMCEGNIAIEGLNISYRNLGGI